MLSQEEIVIIEQTKDDGRKAQIVYRNGGIVSAAALEALCVRVCTRSLARMNCHLCHAVPSIPHLFPGDHSLANSFTTCRGN